MPVYHFDAYRLKNSQEMLDIGSDEMIYGNGVALVELADNVSACLPEACLKITLRVISQNERRIEICGYGNHHEKIIKIALEEFVRREKSKILIELEGKVEISFALPEFLKRRKSDVPHRLFGMD